MRQNAAAKARAYLCDGRLIILRVNGDTIHATCRGDGHVYSIVVRGDDASCDCPARGRCAHLLAVGLVTATNRVPT